MIRDPLLYQQEAPKLTRVEVIHVAATKIVEVLRIDRRRALEGILSYVHHSRHVSRDLPARLAEELELEISKPQRAESRSGEVEEVMALGGPFVL
jgi:hypothetical protein